MLIARVFLRVISLIAQTLYLLMISQKKASQTVQPSSSWKRIKSGLFKKQVAQWATLAHHGASIMFGDTIDYDAQRLITLNLKQ